MLYHIYLIRVVILQDVSFPKEFIKSFLESPEVRGWGDRGIERLGDEEIGRPFQKQKAEG
jgi:hypothetical protein